MSNTQMNKVEFCNICKPYTLVTSIILVQNAKCKLCRNAHHLIWPKIIRLVTVVRYKSRAMSSTSRGTIRLAIADTKVERQADN